jgi:hypothetical protein
VSARTVRAEIDRALRAAPLRDAEVTVSEAGRIVRAAEQDGRVSGAETREITRFLERAVDPRTVQSDAMQSLPADRYFLPQVARERFDAFFARHGLPDCKPVVSVPDLWSVVGL